MIYGRASPWTRCDVPFIAERLIGFSVPMDDRIVVISYEGTHVIALRDRIEVHHDSRHVEYDIYDPGTGVARYQGRDWTIIGLHGGRPLLTSPCGDSLTLDRAAQRVVVGPPGEEPFTVCSEDFSGDRAAATFSPDGVWLALGCAYGDDFVLLRRRP